MEIGSARLMFCTCVYVIAWYDMWANDDNDDVQTLHSINAEVKDVIGHTISGSGEEEGMLGGTALPPTPTPSPLYPSV